VPPNPVQNAGTVPECPPSDNPKVTGGNDSSFDQSTGQWKLNCETIRHATQPSGGNTNSKPNPSTDSCIWPQCYVPYDNIQQYGTDDNCRAPACLIDLNKGTFVYSPNPSDNTNTDDQSLIGSVINITDNTNPNPNGLLIVHIYDDGRDSQWF
jgi:hypothetical protein